MQDPYDRTEYTELPTRSNEIHHSLSAPKDANNDTFQPQQRDEESKEVVHNLTDKLKEVAQLTKESMAARNKASNELAKEHWNRAKDAYERRVGRSKKKPSKTKRAASTSPSTSTTGISEASDDNVEHIYLNGRKYSLVPVGRRSRSASKSSTTSASTTQASATSSSEGDYEDENAKIREKELKMEKHRQKYAHASEEAMKAASRLKKAWLEVGQEIISSILVHTGERAEHLTDETLQAIKAKHRENKERYLIKKHEKAKDYYEGKKEKKHRDKHRREMEGKPKKSQKDKRGKDRTPTQYDPAIKHHRQQREQATQEADHKRDMALRKLKEAALEIWESVKEASKETLHEVAHQTAEGLKAKTKELEEQSKRIAAEKGRKLAEQQRGKLAKDPAKIQHLRTSNENRSFISQENPADEANPVSEPTSQNMGSPTTSQNMTTPTGYQPSQGMTTSTDYQPSSQNLNPAGYQMNAAEPTYQVKPNEPLPVREEKPSKLDQVKHKIKDTLGGGKSNQEWEEAARREEQRRLHGDHRPNISVM